MERLREREVDAEALRAVRIHRDQWVAGHRPPQGLWLWGPTNARKTALMCALAFDVAQVAERRCQIWNLELLMREVQKQARDEQSRLRVADLENAELLVLDDLGSVKVTEAAWRQVFGIAEGALSGWGGSEPWQTLYVTSNEDPETIERLYSVRGMDRSGQRLVRRLVQLCEVVEVRGQEGESDG